MTRKSNEDRIADETLTSISNLFLGSAASIKVHRRKSPKCRVCGKAIFWTKHGLHAQHEGVHRHCVGREL